MDGRDRQRRRNGAAAVAGYWEPGAAYAGGVEAPHRPTSEALLGLLRDTTDEHVTLAWLLESLRERSFGVILLVLAVIGMLPGVATLTGLLLLVPATQMILARQRPMLPAGIASRRLPARRVARLVGWTSRLLGWMERFAYPRWAMPLQLTQRVVGIVVMLLALSLLSPLPFAQIVPNLVIILIAFSLLEKDGVLLALSLVLAPLSLAFSAASVWATFAMAGFL